MPLSKVKQRMSGVLITASGITFSVQHSWTQASSRPVSANGADKFSFGKTKYIKNEHGSETPYNVIAFDIKGWGHFEIVNSADKAQIIAEITSYEGIGTACSGTAVPVG